MFRGFKLSSIVSKYSINMTTNTSNLTPLNFIKEQVKGRNVFQTKV